MMDIWGEIAPTMLAFVVSRGTQMTDAEDIVNTVFVRVWQKRFRLSVGAIRMYCWRVLFNLIKRRGRNKWLRCVGTVERAGKPSTEDVAVYKDLLRFIKGTLTKDQYSALLISVDAIRGHEMTSGSYRATLFRARRKLKGMEDLIGLSRDAS